MVFRGETGGVVFGFGEWGKMMYHKRIKLDTLGFMTDTSPVLTVVFYQTSHEREPVREWLQDLDTDARRCIGSDIRVVQQIYPVGMPLVRKLDSNLWEVRSHIPQGIARVLFTVSDGCMVLLHGFIKKSQKTPKDDLELAKNRLATLEVKP